MKEKLEGSNLTFANQSVSIKSSLCEKNIKEIEDLANELAGYKGIRN